MKKETKKAGSIALVVLYAGIIFGYVFGQSGGKIGKEQETAKVVPKGKEQMADVQETEEGQAKGQQEEAKEEEKQETEEITQVLSTEEERKIIESTWANSHRSRIDYMDGYYYYASQSDHYYLYRVKEDGSEPQCMAKIHPGSICARDGYVYFINQSDSHGIYRIKADGTGMEKLCEDGHDLQIGDEYLFFCSSSYEETLETTGIIVEGQKNGGLYRMKKDGSERELIAEDVWDYLLSDGYSQETQNMVKFDIVKISEREHIYVLKYNEETLKMYPFKFELYISYIVDNNTLTIKYRVKNLDDKAMFFGIGGHPAFVIDLKPPAASPRT